MNVAGAQASFSYLTNLNSSGQANAVFQALAQTYSALSASNKGNDPLTALVGRSNLNPLVNAIYTQGKALQESGTADADSKASGLLGLQPSQLIGGLESGTASSFLTQVFGDSASALQGFGVALNTSTLAAAAAEARKAYGSGTLTADAQSQAASDGTSSASQVLQATLGAQRAALNNTFTLLA